MNKGFQLRGDSNNPYHLSVGAVVLENNKVALLKKSTGTYTLPRETMHLQESLEQALLRGLEEELGITAKIESYLGTLITHFNRPDGTDIEKTAIYFLVTKTGSVDKNQAEDEVDDELVWFEVSQAIEILKDQNNEEYSLIERVT